MKYLPILPVCVWLLASTTSAQSFQRDVAPLVQASCIQCHDAGTDTGLNFEALGDDLTDSKTFRSWEKVFDRAHAAEMPPESEERPDPKQLKTALAALQKDLRDASLSRQQQVGRVPARRLTKLEFGFTLRDLLYIESDVTSGIPDEVESGSFDTVGATQRISAVHMESYLQAADEAIRLAIRLGKNPYRVAETDFTWLNEWHEKPLNLGGSITRKLQFGTGIVLFADVDYLTQFRFYVSIPGIHRLTAKVAAYQSREPVTAKLIVKDQTGGARLVKSHDLQPGEPETIVVDTFLKPGDMPYLTFDAGAGPVGSGGVFAAGGAKHYKGKGMAILSQKVEGPLFESWPPKSTRQIMGDIEPGSFNNVTEAEQDAAVLGRITDVVERLAPRVFRRRPSNGELQSFVELAKPAIEAGREFVDILRIPLRSMLSSPQFVLFGGQAGELDDFALANRLSYFLWKSMPDDELFGLASEGKLSEPECLAAQVERMLADQKSNRFVRDFLGQWLRLHKVNATTPDEGLYPEYDELLASAIPIEPELFFAELIRQNLSLTNVIDSEFTFVNRRLGEHYELEGIQGQDFRKVRLPRDSPRGGVLTQAAILKTTANGTTTSPVIRGNFVLTNFLGTPPSPPPPDVGSIEPDTRGKTTIREILASHREIETCNQCHRVIDPPGFALESFDPIGRYRDHYRISGGEQKFGDFRFPLPPRQGLPVDASGVSEDGKEFSGIEEFKLHLLDQKEQVARNFISQLVVYSTGGEIQFADREEIESILERTSKNGFPVKDIIHEVVQSKLFRNK